MKTGKTVLSIYALVFLLVISLHTILSYDVLAKGEGWGIVAMFGLFGLVIILLLVDRMLVWLIKNSKWVNRVGAAIAILITILIFKDSLM